MFFSSEATHLTLDSTAPDKLTVTLLFHIPENSLVTTATTEESAAVDAIARAVAQATSRAQDAYPAGREKESSVLLKGTKI